jgi:hypothetical protein
MGIRHKGSQDQTKRTVELEEEEEEEEFKIRCNKQRSREPSVIFTVVYLICSIIFYIMWVVTYEILSPLQTNELNAKIGNLYFISHT